MVLQEYFPNTKIIISVRHPVLWFESYYNYRLQQKEFSILKGTPNELIGELDCNGCQNSWILSTAKGRFHRYLARLLKTPLSDPTEMQLLGVPHRRDKLPLKQLSKTKNPVFFMELTQLGDTDEVRSGQFRHDLQTFLGLETEFPVESLPHVHPGNVGHPTRHSRPGKVVHQRKESHRGKKVQQHQARNSHPGNKVPQHQARNSHSGKKMPQHHARNSHPGKKVQHQARNNSTIDICNDEYFPVRQDLMDISRNASLWFRNYFLASDEVFVSSRDYLDQILEGWMIDPCQERSMSQQ